MLVVSPKSSAWMTIGNPLSLELVALCKSA
jgi:hypothetical protein